MAIGDLTTLDHVKQWLGLTGLAIASISNANPALVTLSTAPQTPLLNQMQYEIWGVEGMALVPNGLYTITVTSPITFTIPVNTTADTSYSGGGVVGVDDTVVANLISRCSAGVQSWLKRTIASGTYTETHDGLGGQVLQPNQYPVVSVSSLTIDGIVIPPRPPLGVGTNTVFSMWGTSYGWVASNDAVMLVGAKFTRDWQNVVVTYVGGFQNSEATVVPSSGPFTLTTQLNWSAGDRGVVYTSSGTALKKVASNPFTGQYTESNGVYNFAIGDAGQAVTITYAYVPPDVEQATIDWISDWFRYRDRIGVKSRGIQQAGNDVFDMSPMPTRCQQMLFQYKRQQPFMT